MENLENWGMVGTWNIGVFPRKKSELIMPRVTHTLPQKKMLHEGILHKQRRLEVMEKPDRSARNELGHGSAFHSRQSIE